MVDLSTSQRRELALDVIQREFERSEESNEEYDLKTERNDMKQILSLPDEKLIKIWKYTVDERYLKEVERPYLRSYNDDSDIPMSYEEFTKMSIEQLLLRM